MNDEVLTYLQGDSQGAKRDAITRCYYEVAQGDPKSGPVAFAVLLDACAEQVAKTPDRLLNITSDFLSAVNTARQLECRVIERQEKNNASVIAAFKDETARACLIMQETAIDNKATMLRNERTQEQQKRVLTRLEEIEYEVRLLRDDLRKERETDKQTAAPADKIQSLVQQDHALVQRLGKEARAGWITVGLGFGMALAYALDQTQAPPLVLVIFFLVIVGLIQGLSRWNWKFVRRQTKKISSPAEAKQ